MTEPRWKQIEREIALMFGAKGRRHGSGAWSGRGGSDPGQDDIIHPVLYVECKHQKAHAAQGLMEEAARKAKEDGKRIPVVALHTKGKMVKDTLICVRPRDLLEVALWYEITSDRKAQQQMREEAPPDKPRAWIPLFAERLTGILQDMARFTENYSTRDEVWGTAVQRYQNGRAAVKFELGFPEDPK